MVNPFTGTLLDPYFTALFALDEARYYRIIEGIVRRDPFLASTLYAMSDLPENVFEFLKKNGILEPAGFFGYPSYLLFLRENAPLDDLRTFAGMDHPLGFFTEGVEVFGNFDLVELLTQASEWGIFEKSLWPELVEAGVCDIHYEIDEFNGAVLVCIFKTALTPPSLEWFSSMGSDPEEICGWLDINLNLTLEDAIANFEWMKDSGVMENFENLSINGLTAHALATEIIRPKNSENDFRLKKLGEDLIINYVASRMDSLGYRRYLVGKAKKKRKFPKPWTHLSNEGQSKVILAIQKICNAASVEENANDINKNYLKSVLTGILLHPSTTLEQRQLIESTDS